MADDFVMNDSEEMETGRPLSAAEVDTDEDWDVDPAEFYAEPVEEEDSGTDQTDDESETSDETEEDPADNAENVKADPDSALAEEMKEAISGFYNVKVLGEQQKISKDEATITPILQKGLDYDRIREERDSLKAESKSSRGVLAALKQQADSAGMTVEDYIDYLSIDRMKAADKSLDSVSALMKARNARLAAEKEANEQAEREEAERNAAEQARREQEDRELKARQAMYFEFTQEYPDVPSTEIPPEVWAGVRQGKNLTALYTKYVNRTLKAENDKLRQEQKNKSRSAGSMQSKGGTRRADPTDIDSLWDDGT